MRIVQQTNCFCSADTITPKLTWTCRPRSTSEFKMPSCETIKALLPAVLSGVACAFASLRLLRGPIAAMTLTSTSVGMARSLMGSLVWSGRLYTIVVTPFFRSPDTKTASLRPPRRSSGHTPLFPSHCGHSYELSYNKREINSNVW